MILTGKQRGIASEKRRHGREYRGVKREPDLFQQEQFVGGDVVSALDASEVDAGGQGRTIENQLMLTYGIDFIGQHSDLSSQNVEDGKTGAGLVRKRERNSCGWVEGIGEGRQTDVRRMRDGTRIESEIFAGKFREVSVALPATA